MVLYLIVIINIYYSEGEFVMDEKERRRFKKVISQLESSGGKNTKHKMMTKGLHKGDTAIGEYGLMPLTIQDAAKMRVRQGIADEMDEKIAKMTVAEVKALVPGLVKEFTPEYEKYADTLSEHVLKKYEDPKLAAFAWNQGHYTEPEKIKKMITNPKSDHQKNYLPRLERALARIDKQDVADKAFATTKGVMEVDPKKSDFARLTDVDLKSPKIVIVPDYKGPTPASMPPSKSFIAPLESYDSEEIVDTEPTESSKFKNILSKLVDPSSISYRRKKQEEEV